MNRTITPIPALTGHPSARRRSLRHAALVALVAAACTADTLDGRQPDAATGPDVLTFAVSARPAFTEAPATRADGTTAPATRATQTDNGTHWEQGDILWLQVFFSYDKQNIDIGAADTAYISALKYDANEWRYLTQAEAEDLNTGNIPCFSRLVRWPRESKDWVDPGISIVAYYAGSGKPDADGTITIIPHGEIPTMPLIIGGTDRACSPGEKLVLSEFTGFSRLRIPAGYAVELPNTFYFSAIEFSSKGIISREFKLIDPIPAQSEDTDVFLILNPGSTATLTRGNVSYTFTFTPLTYKEGTPIFDAASYTLTPYTSGTETPVADYDLTIADEAGLRAFAQAVNAGDRLPNGKPAAEARVLQTANIHLTQEWVPIGTGLELFCGAYNGNGHEITGLTIRTAQPNVVGKSFVGLFGRVDGAVLTGIKLRKVEINIPQGGDRGSLFVGSVAGYVYNSTLSLCTADGTVNASGGGAEVIAGGIAGYNYGSTISRCRADVEIKATITLADGSVRAGGIAGSNIGYSFILSCETGDRAVTAEGVKQVFAGGITGENDIISLIAFCHTGANVVTARNGNTTNSAGGLVGNNIGFLYSCYSRATATVTGTGTTKAGAIAGNNNEQNRVQHCYATGAVDKGTSNLDPSDGNIVYNTNPGAGKIFGVMTGFTGEVESITSGGTTYYPFTTSYAPSATPAYGIIPQRAVWKNDGPWNIGDGTYPKLNIDEYEGK